MIFFLQRRRRVGVLAMIGASSGSHSNERNIERKGNATLFLRDFYGLMHDSGTHLKISQMVRAMSRLVITTTTSIIIIAANRLAKWVSCTKIKALALVITVEIQRTKVRLQKEIPRPQLNIKFSPTTSIPLITHEWEHIRVVVSMVKPNRKGVLILAVITTGGIHKDKLKFKIQKSSSSYGCRYVFILPWNISSST
ncbi:hypothetical protein E3N88_34762 [Mikania micrantha]|uniref:Uncharacterized protein n=1 Tax=Mikania micrantha TaxID=192012 RepID=A0A5N6LZF1_9ASTR|nr:hypothetical protein E3N88_34762 [Mikania micrantha]